jgi:hypothetical protein
VTPVHKLLSFWLYKKKILSGFAIGHPGQRRVPQLVLANNTWRDSPEYCNVHTDCIKNLESPNLYLYTSPDLPLKDYMRPTLFLEFLVSLCYKRNNLSGNYTYHAS